MPPKKKAKETEKKPVEKDPQGREASGEVSRVSSPTHSVTEKEVFGAEADNRALSGEELDAGEHLGHGEQDEIAKQAEDGRIGSEGVRRRKMKAFARRRKTVESYAAYIGMDVQQDRELLWLAEEGLFAPLPAGWKEYFDVKGQPYYYHTETKTSQWHHPKDVEIRDKFLFLKELQGKVKAAQPGSNPKARAKRESLRVKQSRLQLVAGFLLIWTAIAVFVGLGWSVLIVYDGIRLDGSIMHTFRQVAGLLGSHDSQVYVGHAYLQGHGTVQDTVLALRWFKRAAEGGDVIAQRTCGILLSKGVEGTAEQVNQGAEQLEQTRDVEQAGWYFGKAAAQGDKFSMSMLGYLHYTGRGMARDYMAAQMFTQRAAESGEPNAMLMYGVMFLEGKALTRDVLSAYKWLLLARKFSRGSKSIEDRADVYMEHAKAALSHEDEEKAQIQATKFVVRED